MDKKVKTAKELDIISDKQTNSTPKELPNPENSQAKTGVRKERSISGMEEKIVSIKKINKTTKGGRRMRFSALAIIGDKNGKVGYGTGKSVEVPVAIKKAIKNAQKNIHNVEISKTGTVYHEVVAKQCASKILIKPAPPGTGIIAGGSVRTIVELAGYTDIYSKNMGSNCTLNMIHATLKALKSQNSPRTIAALRNKDIKTL